MHYLPHDIWNSQKHPFLDIIDLPDGEQWSQKPFKSTSQVLRIKMVSYVEGKMTKNHHGTQKISKDPIYVDS